MKSVYTYKTFSSFLRAWAKASGLSVRKAGLFFGFRSSAAFCSILKGRIKPSPDFLNKLLEVCPMDTKEKAYLMTLWLQNRFDLPKDVTKLMLEKMASRAGL